MRLTGSRKDAFDRSRKRRQVMAQSRQMFVEPLFS